ncbi:MAG: hypothetical protein ABID63_02475 [Pseudomonadota bacterium]
MTHRNSYLQRYHLIFGIAVLVLAWLMMSGPVMAQTHICRFGETPPVSLSFVNKDPQLDRSRSVRWLNQRSNRNSRWIVSGLTEYELRAAFDMKIEPVAAGNGLYCLWPARVLPRVEVVKHLVYVASELVRGTCEYDVVYAHEAQHVAINQRIEDEINKAMQGLVETITQDFAAMTALPASMVQNRSQQLLTRYGRDFQNLITQVDRARTRDHAAIDTSAEYGRIASQCGPDSAFTTTLQDAMRR